MSSADRLDQLLRAELRRADDLPVASRYDAVLARSRQRTRRRRIAVGALAVVLVAVGAGIGSTRLPDGGGDSVVTERAHGLSGSWSRTVTDASVGEGAWTLTFASARRLGIDGPPSRPAGLVTDGATYADDDGLLRVDAFVNGLCTAAAVGSYRWTVTDDLLYLEVEDDRCEERRAVLAGTWVRRP